MPIILSQRIDYESDYQDVPYSVYHFPKRYRNQIKTGDIFIYYQGDRYKIENRYYFGVGVIGAVEQSLHDDSFFAQIVDGKPFAKKVPIHHRNEAGDYIECIGYETVRNRPNPSWQNSIRKLSDAAFAAILEAAETDITGLDEVAVVEQTEDPIQSIMTLNDKYRDYSPDKKEKIINAHIDRGGSITRALKKLLGPICQVCKCEGFEKPNGERYIEAHHLTEIFRMRQSTLCSENVILLCPNCHREIHYGKNVLVEDVDDEIRITLGTKTALVRKNSVEYLIGKSIG